MITVGKRDLKRMWKQGFLVLTMAAFVGCSTFPLHEEQKKHHKSLLNLPRKR